MKTKSYIVARFYNESKPKATLGLCVKNIEATIAHTMKSILEQDFPHEGIEVV